MASIIPNVRESSDRALLKTGPSSDEPKGFKASSSRIFKFNKPIKDYGMKVEAKTFYNDNRNGTDLPGPPNWVDYAPPSLPEIKRHKFDRVAVQVYKDAVNSQLFGNVPTYKVSHIKIQSPLLLKEIRSEEVRGFFNPQDVKFYLNHAEIKAPLKPLFFAREWLLRRQAEAEIDDDELQGHLSVLHEVVERELDEVLEQTERLKETDEINFDMLWTLFPKGELVENWQYSTHCGYRVCCTTMEEGAGENIVPHLWVHCHNVAFDGREFGYNEASFQISRFSGTKKISSLPIYPYKYGQNPAARYSEFVERGRRMLSMQEMRHMQYSGHAFKISKRPFGSFWDITGSWDVDGRVIVDCFLYAKQCQQSRQEVKSFRTTDELNNHKASEDILQIPSTRATFKERETIKASLENDEDKLFIMFPFVDGFSLKEKMWLTFCLECTLEVDYDCGAYEQLVLPEKHKKLVLSLAENHNNRRGSRADYIAGKGQGLLILLSGPPGTGKTLTAEAVADRLKKPLYHVDTHELGGNLSTVSTRLRDIMKFAAEWDAIVLLDEADVYLQRRTGTDLERNEIVATFLRELEYYQGTMFLTTNLFDTVDEAIESRMHVHIMFNRLPKASRYKIWANLLGQLDTWHTGLSNVDEFQTGCLSIADIEQIAAWNLNGRQINNACRMAYQSCDHRNTMITLQEIEDTIAITCPLATKGEDADDSSWQSKGKGKEKATAASLLDFDGLSI